jgi:hypothetical protein
MIKTLFISLLLFPILCISQPVSHAGGTYIVTRENGCNVILDGSLSTGNNLKYQWILLPYYTANDKVTHQTFTGPEPRIGAIKGPFGIKCSLIQISLFNQDSVHTYKAYLTVTDTVAHTSSVDTAIIILRYGSRLPPQSSAGSWHTANSTDVSTYGPYYKMTLGDIFIDGASTNSLLGLNTDIDIRPSFSNTFFTTGTHHRIFIMAGVYRRISMQWDTLGGSAGGPLVPPAGMYDTLVVVGGQLECSSFYISNVRKLVTTGKYSPSLGLGNINYPGHDVTYAYTNKKYGIYINDMFQSTQQLNFQVDGFSTDSCEFSYISSGYGGFTGFTIKPEIGSHPYIFWDNMYVHDCIGYMVHGEIYYDGTANGDPVMLFRNYRFTNNVATFSGNKLFKLSQLYLSNLITRNVGVYGSVNYRSPFETNVSNAIEPFFRDSGNVISNNMIDGVGEQLLNGLTAKVVFPVPGSNLIRNNAFLHSTGFIGSFFEQIDSAFTTNLDSNYFGRNTPYMDSTAYSGTPNGVNTTQTLRALPNGSVASGATRSTYNFTNTIYDSTKYTLTNGDATFTTSNTTLVSLLPAPKYANSGFSQFGNIYPEQWVDSIFNMWGDEFNEGSPTRQPNPTHYNLGSVVMWWGKFYVSNTNNNFSVPGLDGNWTIITFSNGGTDPPMDYRLLKSDTYAKRNIGLLDQVADYITICAGCKIIIH